jgi:hypothetical protein
VANAEKRKSHVKSGAMTHAQDCTCDCLGVALVAPAFAQKAEVEAVNAKWIDFFNKGAPGSGMVKGRAAIEALWKSMAEQVSDAKLTTLDVKPLGSSAAREIGTFNLKTKGPTPQDHRQICRCVGEDRKRLEARGRYLERRQVGTATHRRLHTLKNGRATGHYSRSFGLSAPFASPPCGE